MADTVFVNNLSAIHKGSPGKSMAFPDVNLCPPSPPSGPIPTPLPNMAQAADLAGGASSVTIGGNPMAKKSSYFSRSTGNAVARTTGGGVLTHVVEGQARFVSHSMTVMIEGEPVPRHLDTMTHNHAAMPGEAVGTYLGSMSVSLAGSPVTPEPPVRKDPDPRKPITYEICVQAAGWQQVKQTYRLRSDDRAYDQVGSEAGRKGKDLVRVAFKDVLPGKRYTLVLEKGGEEFPLFVSVPFILLQDHSATDLRDKGRVEKTPKRSAEADAAPPKKDPPADPLFIDEAPDRGELDVVDPLDEEDR